MPVIWKEFPEINRRVAFASNFVGGNMPLGCHAGSISGVSASFGSGYYAANNGRNVEVLDTTKEKPLIYSREEYTGNQCPSKAEISKVGKYLRDIDFEFSSIYEDAYKEIIDKCGACSLWVMSDVINSEAPARKVRSDIGGGGTPVYESFGTTAGFAKYLIDNKIGYMLASPIIQNPSHRLKNNYSLNQAWFWIPPQHLLRAIDTARVYGEEKFPSKEDWIKTVGTDLGIESAEDVLKAVLNDGVFPDDIRFQRYKQAATAA